MRHDAARVRRWLAGLSASEWLLVPQLLGSLLALAVALRFVPLARLTRGLAAGARRPGLRWFPWRHARHRATRLARLVDGIARGVPGQGPCLLGSLLLFWLARARGEPVELFVGVRKDAERDTIEGHAWVDGRGRAASEAVAHGGGFVPVWRGD